MARSEGQKQKLLYLMQLLWERTDENNIITMQEILCELEKHEIKAERKSIYHDIDTLRQFGMDIEIKRDHPAGYYLASRDFEISELKILVDAVQASKFITAQKSRELIKKLERLASVHDAKKLQRQVYVNNRVKTMNKSIYYNVDKIHEAILSNTQITFQYFAWTVKKEARMKRNGALYCVSPWRLIWEDENYYLIAYDSAAGKAKFYRTDKMVNIELTSEMREGKLVCADFDAADFTRKTFSMFNGEEKTLTLKMDNRLAGVMIDRFGPDLPIRALDKDSFQARITVKVSEQFYGWLAGLGKGVRIVSSREEAENYKKFLKRLLKEYK
ncbi:MAG: helix-turn-helix transcriptional regulator [Lachnospiraceae bacterium]